VKLVHLFDFITKKILQMKFMYHVELEIVKRLDFSTWRVQ